MDQYLQIRLLHRDGLSIRQIARQLGHGRETVKKALIEATPRAYTRSKPVVHPKLGPFLAVIDQILTDDGSAPRKQRHTARRGSFNGSSRSTATPASTTRCVATSASTAGSSARRTCCWTTPPGLGPSATSVTSTSTCPGGRRLVPVLVVVWSYSHYPFAIALPDETCGSILHGLVCAFEFFGCVPAELWCGQPDDAWPRRSCVAGTGS